MAGVYQKPFKSTKKIVLLAPMRNSRSPKIYFNKISIFILTSGLITATIIARLFYLQIIQHNYYQNIASTSQSGVIELPAQRGEILLTDHHSGEEFPIATNTTLNLLYADPTLIEDPFYITTQIAPLLFNLEEARTADNERIEEIKKTLAAELPPEEIEELIKPISNKELEKQFKETFTEKISQKQRQEILLITDLEPETKSKIFNLNLAGVEIIDNALYAYPPLLSSVETTAVSLAPHIEIPSKKLEQILKGQNRYVVLKRKLHPDISDQIKQMVAEDKDDFLNGLGMQEEYFRYYPEQGLGANIIGYVNHQGVGQYGIESAYDTDLQGIKGKLQTKKDSVGKLITVGSSNLKAAVDGDDIVLTIDRSVQMKVEEILSAAVKEYRADSGQVVVMNPQTGAITAMAHYPSFNPNIFGEVFSKIEITLTQKEIDELYPTKTEGVYDFYVNPITLDKYPVFKEIDEEGTEKYYRYENFRGPEVYHNKSVSWPYEPGSVFKSVAMAIAIDDGDITPNTTFNDNGPIGVDWNVFTEEYDFEIKNSENKYMGLVNMQTVLGQSLNTGMTFIAKRIGPALFYSYIDKFGFLDRTDIEFDSEAIGKIEYFEDWTESELATHSFGQGITVTMIQLANAYSAIVNGGIMMQAHIIKEIRHDNETSSTNEAKEIRRVISEDSSAKMVEMLKKSVEEGVANRGSVEKHYVGGKTGTSQTYKHGRALSGIGTTITSFAGFGPINDPQFVILVKLDHPRASEWGSSTAAPTFQKIASYLFDYYNIPPDK